MLYSTPIHSILTTSYPWYFDPPTHAISNPYPWYFDPLPMVFWSLYPRYFDSSTHEYFIYFDPLSMVFLLYTWYIEPPTHDISTPYTRHCDPLPMVFWAPNHGISTTLSMVFWPPTHGISTPWTPYPWYIESPTHGIFTSLLKGSVDKWNISVVIWPQIFHSGQPSHGGDRGTFEVMTSPATPAYGVYISQLTLYSTDCASYQDFIDRELTRKLLNQRFLLAKLKSSLRKFHGRHHDLVDRPTPIHGILTPTHGILIPLSMVFWLLYPWYIEPPIHGILNPLRMVFWPPYSMEMLTSGTYPLVDRYGKSVVKWPRICSTCQHFHWVGRSKYHA
jgi:hypothetical protein